MPPPYGPRTGSGCIRVGSSPEALKLATMNWMSRVLDSRSCCRSLRRLFRSVGTLCSHNRNASHTEMDIAQTGLERVLTISSATMIGSRAAISSRNGSAPFCFGRAASRLRELLGLRGPRCALDGFPDSTLGTRSALRGNPRGIAGSPAVDCMVERGRRRAPGAASQWKIY